MVKCHDPLMAKFDFTRNVPVCPVGVISESPDIGAMLGMDMLEPSCTVPTSIGWHLASRNWTTNWFCPCLRSPVLLSSTMRTLPTACVATSFIFSVLVDFAPQPARPRTKNNIMKTTDNFFMDLSPWSEFKNHEIVSVESVGANTR